MLKLCSKCKESKPLEDFSTATKALDGKRWDCKSCVKKADKIYRDKNKDRILNQRKQNSEIIKAKAKLYYQNNLDKMRKKNKLSKIKYKDKILVTAKKYKIENKDKINAYRRQREKFRRKIDSSYKLITNQRTRITGILKKHKTDKTLDLLGCSAQFLRTYLENKFLEGMTWDNYGKDGWHVDHIIPCSSFDLTDQSQQLICFHYTNLQPLWAIDNIKKGNKILSKG